MHSCQDIVGLYYVGSKQILLQMLLCYFIDSFAYFFFTFLCNRLVRFSIT